MYRNCEFPVPCCLEGGQAEQCQSASAGGKKKAEQNRICVLRSLKERHERMRRQRLEGITATICRDCLKKKKKDSKKRARNPLFYYNS